ncbi:DUF2537 domain-containing protein [Saccharopolyspora rhizosphaerae]|uniref:DUF2537 domain-containing protein n=1 Tax=Saccharopolyspora rhizosphaerae TaxID=2492662 RepID=A0A426JQH4_9PSEU|nr:DUF2537 domain-containing protein [Saccharopolyspora rhizosphaerae]RRO15365.1 DUF2537 domain-containing protein [Saccharopolyspora rhizosphaerae]
MDTGWELHARSGRAVLVRGGRTECDPARLGLPESLVTALHEWAGVAELAQTGDAEQTGEIVSRRGRQLATRLAAETGGRIGYVDPFSGEVAQIGRPRSARAVRRGERPLAPESPTPWGPGLVISAVVGAIVAVTLTVVSQGLADVSGVLAVFVNIATAAGFAPSIWLGRTVPVWRWVAFGTAAGLVASWIAGLLSLLG